MRQRYLWSLVAMGSLALASLAVVTLTGQTPATPSTSGTAKSAGSGVPRTPWGTADLQGTWFVLYDVPLERSAANKDKPFLTDAEVAAANKAKETSPGRNLRSSGAQDVSGAYNAVFNSVLKAGKRTSMVIDPPDGRIPPLVAGAQPEGRGGRGGGAPAVGGLGLGLGAVNDNPETV